MVPPLAQSSPPGKEEHGRRESERRESCKKQREETEVAVNKVGIIKTPNHPM